MERFRIDGIDKTFRNFAGGEILRIRQKVTPVVAYGETAFHEALHAVMAGWIHFATIIPHGFTLGSVTPKILDAATAAAAGAFGLGGTSWDKFLVQAYLRKDWEIAKSTARNYLSSRMEEVHQVAMMLEQKKTIVQGDLNEALERARKVRLNITDYLVTVVRPDGKVLTREVQTKRNRISVRGLTPLTA